MPQPTDFYMAFRLEARNPCDQNCFDTKEQLFSWLRRGRNKQERVRIDVIRRSRLAKQIWGIRADLEYDPELELIQDF